jgi:hypothetical protein
LLPQLVAPPSRHVPVGSDWPSGTLVQMPIDVGCAHDLHALAQPVAQQTPWAQLPFMHSPPLAQAMPFAFLVQLPPIQLKGATQSALVVHVVRQAPVPQTYGSHIDVVAAWQVPVPLHDRAEVSVDPVQLAADEQLS